MTAYSALRLIAISSGLLLRLIPRADSRSAGGASLLRGLSETGQRGKRTPDGWRLARNEGGSPLVGSAEARDVRSPARDLPQRERRPMVALSRRRWTCFRLTQSQPVFRWNGD